MATALALTAALSHWVRLPPTPAHRWTWKTANGGRVTTTTANTLGILNGRIVLSTETILLLKLKFDRRRDCTVALAASTGTNSSNSYVTDNAH